MLNDLVLNHKKNDGQMWVSTRPLTPKNRDKNLEVFTSHYIESLAGTFSFRSYSPLLERVRVEKGFATRVIARSEGKLGPYAAVMIDIEVADLDQLQLDENHRTAILRVLFAKIPGRVWSYNNRSFALEERSGKNLLFCGYYNTPKYFKQNLLDFKKLLESIVFFKKTDPPNTTVLAEGRFQPAKTMTPPTPPPAPEQPAEQQPPETPAMPEPEGDSGEVSELPEDSAVE